MYPIRPTPTLVVDAWGFRLADPDGNLIGKQSGVTVTNPDGTVLPMPAAERLLQALERDN